MVSDTFSLKINLLKVVYQTHWVHHHNHTLTTTDIVAPTLECCMGELWKRVFPHTSNCG